MPRQKKHPQEDENKKLIPLRRLAQESSYSPAYVSILVQRKKLKAKKIGRNYFSTREWFNQYLENHARDEKRDEMIKKQARVEVVDKIEKAIEQEKVVKAEVKKEIKSIIVPELQIDKKIIKEKKEINFGQLKKILSINLITDPEYFSDKKLVRQIFNTWNGTFRNLKNQKIKKGQLNKTKKIKKLHFYFYHLKNHFNSLKKLELAEASKQASFFITQKLYQAKFETLNLLRPRPVAKKYIALTFIIILTIVPIVKYYPEQIKYLTSKFSSTYNFISTNSISYANKFKDQLSSYQISLFTETEKISDNKNLYGRIAGISEKAKSYTAKKQINPKLLAKVEIIKSESNNIVSSIINYSGDVITSTNKKQIELSERMQNKFKKISVQIPENNFYNNYASLFSEIKNTYIKKFIALDFYKNKIKEYNNKFWQSSNYLTSSINSGFNKGRLNLAKFFGTSQINKINKARIAGEQETGEGVVIVPFKNDYEANEIKEKIDDLFSDEVEVEVDETKRAGIIKPVFGTEINEQEYLYMMVPVVENE